MTRVMQEFGLDEHTPLLLTLNYIYLRQIWFIFSLFFKGLSQTQTQLYSHIKKIVAQILNYTRENETVQLVYYRCLLHL